MAAPSRPVGSINAPARSGRAAIAATLIDTESYLLTCMRYIELNPVRAGTVSHPSEYSWSSYRHNSLGQADGLVAAHQEYRRLGKTGAARQAAYRQLFKARIAERTLTDIREATNKAWALGNDRCNCKIEAKLERRVAPRVRGGDHKSGTYKNGNINRV